MVYLFAGIIAIIIVWLLMGLYVYFTNLEAIKRQKASGTMPASVITLIVLWPSTLVGVQD